jgi:formylglycine-generating enzyme required for sulfatase activity
MVVGLVGALAVLAQEVKSGKAEVIELGKDVKLEMLLIPAGKFLMGGKKIPVDPFSNIKVEQPEKDEFPQHEVTLTKPFYMGKNEVTQEQWESVMGNNPSKEKGKKLPVTNVSWEDCQEFIKKLNKKTDGGYRLPTEAEWEYACRAGTTTAYSYGDKLTKSDANILGSSIKTVGSYKPNAFGLYDMHGNVWEWCEDWYGDYPAGAVIDPKGPATGKYRVLRGGSFFTVESFARSSDRVIFVSPTGRIFFGGFRLARTADIKATVAEPTAPIPGSTELTPATKGLLVATFSEVKAKEAQKQLAKSLKKEVEEKEDLGKDVKLEMVLIPAGKFKMGSPASEKGRRDNETQHEVTLTKPFYMGKYEVTQEQWEAVMGDNPSSSKTKGAKLPVTDVSWNDCQDFIKKLNASTKGGYRLPTEAEWEYTCRAGTSTAYSYGDNLSMSDANTHGASIKAVGSYKPNAFGLYDMHGNVWEWCEDWYGAYSAGAVTDPRTDPRGLAPAKRRVLRGGSFYVVESYARSSARNDFTPTVRGNGVGFRLARTK